MDFYNKILNLIERSTKSLEKLSKLNNESKINITSENGYLWSAENFSLIPVKLQDSQILPNCSQYQIIQVS